MEFCVICFPYLDGVTGRERWGQLSANFSPVVGNNQVQKNCWILSHLFESAVAAGRHRGCDENGSQVVKLAQKEYRVIQDTGESQGGVQSLANCLIASSLSFTLAWAAWTPMKRVHWKQSAWLATESRASTKWESWSCLSQCCPLVF